MLIHLHNFSLWVTSKYSNGGMALPCFKQGDEELPDDYKNLDIDLSKYEEHWYLFEMMRDHIEGRPSRISAAYFRFIRQRVQTAYNWKRCITVRLDLLLSQALQVEDV